MDSLPSREEAPVGRESEFYEDADQDEQELWED